MAKYYFVTTLLPPLKIGSPPEITSNELEFTLKMNLTKSDYNKVVILRRFVEIENIRRFWRGEPIEEGGNFNEKEIEESHLHLENYPSYVFDFMEKYDDTSQRLKHFPELLRDFFRHEMKKSDGGFVQEYLKLEWELRLIFVALRAKDLGRDLAEELKFEDPEDPFVQQILEQKDDPSYIPPNSYASLKELFEEKKSDPLALNLELSQWRFNKIDEMMGWHTFDINKVLSYVVQLKIVEKWLKLDKKKGLELVEKIIK